jgi:hypothetical protein
MRYCLLKRQSFPMILTDMPDQEGLPVGELRKLEKLGEVIVFSYPEIREGLSRLAAHGLGKDWEDWDKAHKEWAERLDAICHGISHLLEGVMFDLNGILMTAGVESFHHDRVSENPYLSVWDAWVPVLVRRALRNSDTDLAEAWSELLSESPENKSPIDDGELDAFIAARTSFSMTELFQAFFRRPYASPADFKIVKAMLLEREAAGKLRYLSGARYGVAAAPHPDDTPASADAEKADLQLVLFGKI